jgi:predicted membrane protein
MTDIFPETPSALIYTRISSLIRQIYIFLRETVGTCMMTYAVTAMVLFILQGKAENLNNSYPYIFSTSFIICVKIQQIHPNMPELLLSVSIFWVLHRLIS